MNTRDRYTNKELLAQIEKEYGNYDEAIALYKSQIEGRPDSYWSDAPRKALMEIYMLQGDTKLYKLYPDRCLVVLANAADRQAKSSKNRRDYKYIAKTLKKIASRPGGEELASELAAKYRTMYPRRTAMIDELKSF